MAAIDVTDVIERLEQAPVALQTAMLAPPDGVPNAGGFYAWWAKQGVLDALPERPHPLDRSLSLLYVGISPARASSGQKLRGRLLGNHINGNTGSSTFRFVLASLLMSSLDLHPYRTTTKVSLDEGDNSRLREWQFANLRLSWCERERPWEIEEAVIQAMQPPLNTAGNSSHPFFATVKANRAAFRAAALPRGKPGLRATPTEPN
jgi:hypothetical protein